MSQWFESLEEDWASRSVADDDDDYGTVEEIGSWADLTKRDLLRILEDGVNIDGSEATEEEESYAAGQLRERYPKLWADCLAAYKGLDESGEPVSPEDRLAAYERLDTARLQREELSRDPVTGELVFRTGDEAPARDSTTGRMIVGTPSSDRKMPSVRLARAIIERACAQSGQDLAALTAPFARGRLTGAETARRGRLALIVADARRQGATLEAIGGVIDQPKQRVQELAKLGETLGEKLAS